MKKLKGYTSERIIELQVEQHSQAGKKNQTATARKSRRDLDIGKINRVFPTARSILCLGCRDDSEVEAFIDSGYEAQGADILDSTSLIQTVDAHDILEHFGAGSFDLIYASHVLEHVLDAPKVLRGIRSVARQGVYIVLPIQKQDPRWKHPTVFDVMQTKSKHESAALADDSVIGRDFSDLQPYHIQYKKFRDGITEPREFCLIVGFRDGTE